MATHYPLPQVGPSASHQRTPRTKPPLKRPRLLGTPDGISGSHNKYETDTSPTRGDLYQYGNDYALQASQFQTLFDLQPDAATANYNLEVLAKERKITFECSIVNNSYFFYGPFTGMAVSQAAHTFIYRFMSNKSAENPEGVLNQDVLKSSFAITGESGNFTYNPGLFLRTGISVRLGTSILFSSLRLIHCTSHLNTPTPLPLTETLGR
jgi:hypothetical protein